MKQLFGFTGSNFYAFLPSRRTGCIYNSYDVRNNQGMVTTYYAGERKICGDILLSDQIFESDFNEDRVSTMKEYLIDRKITGLETINPDWEICVDYTIYDNTGRIVNSGITRVDAETTDIQLARNSVGDYNELVYTYGKKANGTVFINIGHQASYGLKKVESVYPLQFIINKIYIQCNTYSDELMCKMNKMRAARHEPNPHIRHSDLLTDPRYYYDRYPHQCQPIDIIPQCPSFPGMEGGTSYQSRFPIDEYGRPTHHPILGKNDIPIPDYVPGPIPYVDHYMPVPNPYDPHHPMYKPLPYPRYANGIDYNPAFRYLSCAARKQLEEKYRKVPHYNAPRITIYEVDGSALRYNGIFRQDVQSVCLNISIILDNFVLIKDDSEIIKILESNSPLSQPDNGNCQCAHKHPQHHHCVNNCDCCDKKENDDIEPDTSEDSWCFYTGLVWEDKDSEEISAWPEDYASSRTKIIEWFTSMNTNKFAPVVKFTDKNGECSISGNYGYPIFMWDTIQDDISDIIDSDGTSVISKFNKYTILGPGFDYIAYVATNKDDIIDARDKSIDYRLVW